MVTAVHTYNRRRFLGISAAALASGAAAHASPTNPDVIVIGAGAAGISAARELRRNGREVIVIEASNRIGGRIFTDTSTFGIPFDAGAHWLHAGEINPFVDYGKRNGFDLYEDPGAERVYVGDRRATRQERAALRSTMRKATSALSRAGRAGRDVSAQSVMPRLGVWGETARVQLGPFEMGKDLSDFSCSDWYTGPSGTDWFCTEGFGALWRHSAQDVPVQLRTKAKVVRWGGKGVQVETNRGTLTAKSCIVTVSTGVLASNDIRFVPALPVRKQDAFHAISMGLYNHVALQLDPKALGVGPDTYIT
ncbi:MAG: FAD-dependent oxidoreductase, partial [Pseudomonadota bacterium]